MTSFGRQPSLMHKTQTGQSIVEIAVSLPFLILIVVALVEMGIVFASYLSLVNAAQVGAMYASQTTDLVDPTCGAVGQPSCTGQHDNDPASGGTITTTIWQEYYNRVANDILIVSGYGLEAGQLLSPPVLTVDRPIIASSTASGQGCPSGAQNTLSIGCPLTVTVHYQIQTLLSNVSLPYFDRLGLPSYYQMNYTFGVPISQGR